MLVKSLKELPRVIAKDGAEIREVLHPKNDAIANHLSLAHATVRKGQETKNHVLEVLEIYYILDGKGVMTSTENKEKSRRTMQYTFILAPSKRYRTSETETSDFSLYVLRHSQKINQELLSEPRPRITTTPRLKATFPIVFFLKYFRARYFCFRFGYFSLIFASAILAIMALEINTCFTPLRSARSAGF